MKSILYARISDNVLDPEDWPVRRLIIEDERIIDHTEMPMTGYPLRSFAGGPQAGWTLEQLLAWSGTDSQASTQRNLTTSRQRVMNATTSFTYKSIS